jgi:hypothetical protein
MRVLHFYTMKQEPERVRAVGPKHAEYWRRAGVHGYHGGPFDDRSGGSSRSRPTLARTLSG